jgi:hypothetical protein
MVNLIKLYQLPGLHIVDLEILEMLMYNPSTPGGTEENLTEPGHDWRYLAQNSNIRP